MHILSFNLINLLYYEWFIDSVSPSINTDEVPPIIYWIIFLHVTSVETKEELKVSLIQLMILLIMSN